MLQAMIHETVVNTSSTVPSKYILRAAWYAWDWLNCRREPQDLEKTSNDHPFNTGGHPGFSANSGSIGTQLNPFVIGDPSVSASSVAARRTLGPATVFKRSQVM